MKKRVKIIVATVLALACAAAAVVALRMPLAVELHRVAPETAVLTFTEQGSYTYTSTFQVYPLVSGEVLEVLVEEGDRVEAGDVLAVVSASDYQHQILQLQGNISGYNAQIQHLALQEQQEKDTLRGELESLRGQMKTLEAQIDQEDPLDESRFEQMALQQSIVRQARRAVEQAEDDFKWIRDMYEDGDLEYDQYAAAQQAVTTAKSSYYAAQITLEQLRSGNTPQGVLEGQQDSLQAQIDAISARLDTSYTGAMAQYYGAQIQSTNALIAQMQEQMGKASVTAPVSGVVDQLPVKDANVIGQQSLVAALSGDAFVEVYVPTRELDSVGVGDRVELLVDKRLGTETHGGTVYLVEDKAQVRLSALGVEERKVRVLVRPEGSSLLLGQEVDVRFTVHTQQDALVVPKTAVFSQNGQDSVWLVRHGEAVVSPVEKGVETREGFVLTAGVAPGDYLVTDADNGALAEGKRIKVPEEEDAAEGDALGEEFHEEEPGKAAVEESGAAVPDDVRSLLAAASTADG